MDMSNASRDVLCVRYLSSRELLDTLRYIESSKGLKAAYIIGEDRDQVLSDMQAHYKIIEAAGGLVKNEKEEYLLIYRNGVWDLPKGKVEKGEALDQAALREVEEETGARGLELQDLISPAELQESTWHTYFTKESRVLKKTYWYHMRSQSAQDLVPQEEEGIERVEWVSSERLEGYLEHSYGSIRDVVKYGLGLSKWN